MLAAGDVRKLRRIAARKADTLDLRDCVVTPGLHDCHTHIFYWALQRALVIDVSAATSLAAALRKIAAGAATKRVGDWVVAQGFNHNRWNTPFPSATDLDTICPHVPVLVNSRDWHTAWLNTAALRRAGITRATRTPAGGRILRDKSGTPTGILQETAVELVNNPLRELAVRDDAAARETIDRAWRSACRHIWRKGYVGVHSVDDAPALRHLQRLVNEGSLGIRVLHAIPVRNFAHAAELGLRSGIGDDFLRLGGVKIFADGSLGAQTAYMNKPYPDTGNYCGVPVCVGAELTDAVRRAVDAGWAVWIHAIGDRAVEEVVRAVAATHRMVPPALPHRIEHAQCVRPSVARRMGRLGIVASVQPCHLPGDIRTADRHWPRARRDAYPFRRLVDAGVVLACGSDAPIEPIDIGMSLHGAVCRADENGEPTNGWFPEQRLTVSETLRAHTMGAAICAGRPAATGTLALGSPADLTVWEDDPFRMRPEELRDVRVRGCIIAGEPHLR